MPQLFVVRESAELSGRLSVTGPGNTTSIAEVENTVVEEETGCSDKVALLGKTEDGAEPWHPKASKKRTSRQTSRAAKAVGDSATASP